MTVLKFLEIKKNQHSIYSNSYEVKFWIKESEFWKQTSELYYAKTKNNHEDIKLRWKNDYKNSNVKLISITYQ